jgi:hypothetical protein
MFLVCSWSRHLNRVILVLFKPLCYILDMLKSIIDAGYVEISEIKVSAVQTRYNEFSIGIKCLPMPC